MQRHAILLARGCLFSGPGRTRTLRVAKFVTISPTWLELRHVFHGFRFKYNRM